MIPGICPPPSSLCRLSAKEALRQLGITAQLVLDAGDGASYDGSSQTWTDVSGSGNHFYRGSSSGADATDPTFAGTAGLVSDGEHFSFDGGDYFSPAGAPTFDDALHHDNALFTIMAVVYPAASGSARCIFGNTNSGTAQGIRFLMTSGNALQIAVQNGTDAVTNNGPANLTLNQWNFAACSINEGGGANASHLWVNGSYVLRDGARSSPGAGNANDAPQIGARGGTSTTQIFQNGERLAVLVVINNAALSPGQVAAFRRLMKGRFPTI
jgi:hypothetical protein